MASIQSHDDSASSMTASVRVPLLASGAEINLDVEQQQQQQLGMVRNKANEIRSRLISLDLFRGLIIVIMAW